MSEESPETDTVTSGTIIFTIHAIEQRNSRSFTGKVRRFFRVNISALIDFFCLCKYISTLRSNRVPAFR